MTKYRNERKKETDFGRGLYTRGVGSGEEHKEPEATYMCQGGP